MFNIPEIRELIPDLTGKLRSSHRRDIDAEKSKQALAMKLLHQRFIDLEVQIELPLKWHNPQTREAIDRFQDARTFLNHGNFDPNNAQRIALPFTEKHVKSIFLKIMTESNKSMENYTKGTGGGPGDDANYVAWEQREETNFV